MAARIKHIYVLSALTLIMIHVYLYWPERNNIGRIVVYEHMRRTSNGAVKINVFYPGEVKR